MSAALDVVDAPTFPPGLAFLASATNWRYTTSDSRRLSARIVVHDDPADQFGGELVAHPTGRICGADAVQHRLGLRCVEESLRPTRYEFEQQPVQSVHDLPASAAELVAPVDQQP